MPDQTTVSEALLEVQREIPNLKLSKDAAGQVAGNRKYRYLSLHRLMAEVLPLLSKHGLVWATFPESGNDGPVLRYQLWKAGTPGGDLMIGTMPLMLDKNNSQGLGSAITYARRYALCAVLGIVADEDDDGQKASVIPAIHDEAPTQEMMSGAQLQNMWNVLGKSKLPEKQLELILAASGIDSKTKDVTIQQGREIRRRLEEAENGRLEEAQND